MAWKMTNVLSGMLAQGAEVTGQWVSLAGESDRNGIVDAVRANYPRVTDRPTVTMDMIETVPTGTKVVVLIYSVGIFGHKHLSTACGRLFPSESGPVLLPKGHRANGYLLAGLIGDERILDIETGYENAATLAERVCTVRDALPATERFTIEHLRALPLDGTDATLALFGTYPFFGGPIPGAVWLLSSYDPVVDIAKGVLLVPPSEAFSEHGSAYGRNLLRMDFGVVTGFDPLSLREALELCDADYTQVLQRLTSAGSLAV